MPQSKPILCSTLTPADCSALAAEIANIDMKAVRKLMIRRMSTLSRQHLRMNGFDPKGLTGEECVSLANQHMRHFLGMDRQNVFTE